jgi:MFS superfamily sulfate permease-like transporter
MDRVAAMTPPPRAVVCDLSNAPHVDISGAEMLKRLASDLRAKGIRLQLVEARSTVRDRLRAEGLDDRLDASDRSPSVADAVAAMSS